MTRTLNQQMSDAHEADMAEWTGGKVQKGSGSQWHAQMDSVDGTRDRVLPMAGDGKATAGRSIGVTREMWAKAVRQAGPVQTPYLALRWYDDPRNLVVGEDLVTISAETFRRLLSGARQWEQQNERLLKIAKLDPIFGGSFSLAPSVELTEAELACPQTGCDCCR